MGQVIARGGKGASSASSVCPCVYCKCAPDPTGQERGTISSEVRLTAMRADMSGACMFVCLVFVHTTLRFFCYCAVCSGLRSVMNCLGFRHAKQEDASL